MDPSISAMPEEVYARRSDRGGGGISVTGRHFEVLVDCPAAVMLIVMVIRHSLSWSYDS